MKNFLKRIASKLPPRWQKELKRHYFGRQIKKGEFRSGEREFLVLEDWVRPGDWVLDIGANVGHYTSRLSALVGKTGRVIAFEPVPDTFEILAANVLRLPLCNVTLVNAAASSATAVLDFEVPKFEMGLDNFYMAHVAASGSDLQVLSLAVDSLKLPRPVSLAKIDVEGHEMAVLEGMKQLLDRDHPVLIVEDSSPAAVELLEGFGYSSEKFEGSSNRVFKPSRVRA